MGAGARGTCVIVGPDGSGKSTVTDAIARHLGAAGVPVRRANPRPGILRPAPMDGPPVRDPHAYPPRSTPVSAAKVAILLLDFWLGHAGPWRKARRDGVVLLERGWYDLVVDPRRYRLAERVVPAVRALGRLLPRAECVVVATGSVEGIYHRCGEISREEVARQLAAWPALAPRVARHVVVCDTTSAGWEAAADTAVRALGAR